MPLPGPALLRRLAKSCDSGLTTQGRCPPARPSGQTTGRLARHLAERLSAPSSPARPGYPGERVLPQEKGSRPGGLHFMHRLQGRAAIEPGHKGTRTQRHKGTGGVLGAVPECTAGNGEVLPGLDAEADPANPGAPASCGRSVQKRPGPSPGACNACAHAPWTACTELAARATGTYPHACMHEGKGMKEEAGHRDTQEASVQGLTAPFPARAVLQRALCAASLRTKGISAPPSGPRQGSALPAVLPLVVCLLWSGRLSSRLSSYRLSSSGAPDGFPSSGGSE